MNEFVSDISGENYPVSEQVPGASISDTVLLTIKKLHPDFNESHNISRSELNAFRMIRMEELLMNGTGHLTDVELDVLRNIRSGNTIIDKMEEAEEGEEIPLTIGQKMADYIAQFGGSWTFIITFLTFMFLWITANVILLTKSGFDPYPFILLNLILSCLAALQAPIIMMSQNRQEEKDRERVKKDYTINLKAELEIRALHEKLDYLVMRQREIESTNEYAKLLKLTSKK